MTDDDSLRVTIDARFASETEIHPNRIEFHTEEEMRRLQGVGTLLKEQRVVDHRPASPIAGSFNRRGAEDAEKSRDSAKDTASTPNL